LDGHKRNSIFGEGDMTGNRPSKEKTSGERKRRRSYLAGIIPKKREKHLTTVVALWPRGRELLTIWRKKLKKKGGKTGF